MTDVVIVAEPPPPPLSTANAVKGAVNAQSTKTGMVTILDHGLRLYSRELGWARFIHLESKQIICGG